MTGGFLFCEPQSPSHFLKYPRIGDPHPPNSQQGTPKAPTLCVALSMSLFHFYLYYIEAMLQHGTADCLDPPLGGLFSIERVRLLCTRTPPGIKVSRQAKNIFAKILESVTFSRSGNAAQTFELADGRLVPDTSR